MKELRLKASEEMPWLKYYTDEEKQTPLPKMNMKQYLIERNAARENLIAIDYYGAKITYGELFSKIEEAQTAFHSLGLHDGDVVCVAAPFIPQTVYSVYALNALGVIVNLVDPRVPYDKLRHYLLNSNSKHLVMLDAFKEKALLIKKSGIIEHCILLSPAPANNVESDSEDHFLRWNDFIQKYSCREKAEDAEYYEGKPAIIIYTSGTSGEPKGAVGSNESYNIIACSQSFSLKETSAGDKFLLIMPPFIAYGLAVGMHGQLCRGQELIMIPNFNIDNQKELLGDLVIQHKPQTIMGVPAFMSDLIKHPKMQNIDCSFLKTVIVGGDGMSIEAEKRVNEFLKSKNSTATICKGWGLTEVNSAFSYTKDKENNLIGSVGIPLLGNNIKIVKPIEEENFDFDDVEELDYGETGEIFICSEYAILDYLNNEEESKRCFFRSSSTGKIWIRTRDVGRITEDGIIFIEGRIKRIIIRPDGHNISPFAIEKSICDNSKVSSCAVVGIKHPTEEHGQIARAFIQLKEGYAEYSTIAQELREKVESELPPRDTASEYLIVKTIPLTKIGKVDYISLKNMSTDDNDVLYYLK